MKTYYQTNVHFFKANFLQTKAIHVHHKYVVLQGKQFSERHLCRVNIGSTETPLCLLFA